jgi:hypothetical protein
MAKTEEARGWAVRIGGRRPYLAYEFSWYKPRIEALCCQTFQRPVRAVLLPLAEYRRLKRLVAVASEEATT